MSQQPYIRFFGTDWRSDPALRMCSAMARGVWIDCITLMMEATPYGHLIVAGKPATAKQIGALTNTPARDIERALAELEENGVSSKTEDGVIYSRRLVRDRARSIAGIANGKQGGNPNLVSVGLTPTEKSEDKASTPDSGNPSPGITTSIPSATSIPKRTRKRVADTQEFSQFWEAYPEKIGKGQARKAFETALASASLEAIMAGVARYKATKPADRAWCHPATFLNGERWLDEPSPLNGEGPAVPMADAERHRLWIIHFRRTGAWPPHQGPKPGEVGCRVAAELLNAPVDDLPNVKQSDDPMAIPGFLKRSAA